MIVGTQDISSFMVGSQQVEKINLGDTEVWSNVIVPSAITDFVASDLEIDKITVTFTNSVGLPIPTYDLYEGITLLVSDITSGYSYVTDRATVNMHVKAINTAGSTNSNEDEGTTKAPAGTSIFAFSDTFISPRGYTSVDICMSGGGGGGFGVSYSCPGQGLGVIGYSNGGKAGEIISTPVAVTAGESISVVIGAAGISSSTGHTDGGLSSFGSIDALGGIANSHQGDSAQRTSCGGTFHDGGHGLAQICPGTFVGLFGGEAGAFGNGGYFDVEGVVMVAAGVGGGGCSLGAAGRGECRVSWS